MKSLREAQTSHWNRNWSRESVVVILPNTQQSLETFPVRLNPRGAAYRRSSSDERFASTRLVSVRHFWNRRVPRRSKLMVCDMGAKNANRALVRKPAAFWASGLRATQVRKLLGTELFGPPPIRGLRPETIVLDSALLS